MKALIYAAGLGTRLKPLTDTKPKALIEINNKPLLEIVIRRLISYGFNDIIINAYHFAEQVIDFIKQNNSFGIRIEISDERGLLLDTGGGLKKASWFFDDDKPFLVHNVDVLSDVNLEELYNFHLKQNALATLAVKSRTSSRYLLFDDECRLWGWQNIKSNITRLVSAKKQDLKPYAFSGIHIIDPAIFKLITEEGYFSIIDVYLRLAKKHKISGYVHDNSYFFDLGKKENFLEAENLIRHDISSRYVMSKHCLNENIFRKNIRVYL